MGMRHLHIKQPPVHPVLLQVDCITGACWQQKVSVAQTMSSQLFCRYLLVCRGSDSLLFVRLLGAAKLTPIFLQSKSSAKGSTVTYMEIYQAAEDNLTTHQVSFGNFSNAEVPGMQVFCACSCMAGALLHAPIFLPDFCVTIARAKSLCRLNVNTQFIQNVA